MPDNAARRHFGAPATWREAVYACTRQPITALAGIDEHRDLSIARRLSGNGAYLRWRDRVAKGGLRDGDQDASNILHDKAPEGRKGRIRKRQLSIDDAIRIQESSGPERPTIEKFRFAAMTITRRASILSYLPRTPESRSSNSVLVRQSTKLDVKREVKWERDSLRGTRDHGALLGGALALSLDHSLVL